jgi:C1A family cysteine protease
MFFSVVLLLSVAAHCVSASLDEEFAAFKLKHKKVYASADEEAMRKQVFAAGVARIASRNSAAAARKASVRFAVNQFTDLEPAEFQKHYLTANVTQPHTPAQARRLRNKYERSWSAEKKAAVESVAQATSFIDWRQHGLVTRVKNQAQCGSCWAFSATEEIESMLLKTYPSRYSNATLALSPQQIVDCDGTSAGCGGGLTESAWDYVISAGGIESNASYPYKAVDQQCAFDASKVVATIKSYTAATSWYSETELLSTLVKEGPVSICLDASSWQDYSSGVMDRLECAWIDQLDHCVQLVGYNAKGPNGVAYWMVRNSWTTSWGIEGYIWLEYGWDVCGLANDANVVVV